MARTKPLILFSSILIFLFLTDSRAKTPIYCETTHILQTEKHELVNPRNEKFRMTVSDNLVEFGINGFTGGTNAFKISNFVGVAEWQSDYDRFFISLLNDDFYFSAVFPSGARAVSARCKIY